MTDAHNNRRLLADVLAEGHGAGVREALLNETLGLVRRKRRSRQVLRIGSVFALVAACFLLLRQQRSGERIGPHSPTSYMIVRTQPLGGTALVETQPFSAKDMVTSGPSAAILATTEVGLRPNEITDEDLLALAAPKAAVLVRLGPHAAELVFAPPPDAGDQ